MEQIGDIDANGDMKITLSDLVVGGEFTDSYGTAKEKLE